MPIKMLFICLLALPVWADEADQLHQHLAAVTALSANFSQQQFDETGQLIDVSSGSMALQKPNLVRWHIEDPFEQVLIGDGRWLWQHDVELAQVVRRPYPPDTSQTPLLVFNESLESLNLNYQVNMNDAQCFVLSPNDTTSLFASMTLCFDDQVLSEFSMLDGFGQLTKVSLRDVTSGAPMAEEFLFMLPDDAELIIDDGNVR
jgi:outer membrane lipoprotein carrier protein